MNKKEIVIFFCITIVILTGCTQKKILTEQSNYSTVESEKYTETTGSPEVIRVDSDSTTLEKTFDRLKVFKKKFDLGEADHIVIESKTIEGDTIISEIITDGKTVKFIYDDSKDKYTSTPGVQTYTSNKIIIKKELIEGQEYDSYYILDGEEYILIW